MGLFPLPAATAEGAPAAPPKPPPTRAEPQPGRTPYKSTECKVLSYFMRTTMCRYIFSVKMKYNCLARSCCSGRACRGAQSREGTPARQTWSLPARPFTGPPPRPSAGRPGGSDRAGGAVARRTKSVSVPAGAAEQSPGLARGWESLPRRLGRVPVGRGPLGPRSARLTLVVA